MTILTIAFANLQHLTL